jgi:uncharacterized membrane protein
MGRAGASDNPTDVGAGRMDIGGLIEGLTRTVSYLAEAAASLVIALAALRAIGLYLKELVWPSPGKLALEGIRLRLGHSLTLGLELLIGADILRTAVAPTWQEIGQLAAIVAIRTVLSYFLSHEVSAAEAREAALRSSGGR